MTTFKATIARKYTALTYFIGSCVMKLVLLAVVVMALQGVSGALGWSGVLGEQQVAAPVEQAPMEQAPAQRGLFNPDAVLDPSRIDDLREDPESLCLASDGVLIQGTGCVDAIALWEDEVPAETWAALAQAGCPIDIDHSDYGSALALRVPAEWVVLGGPGGEEVYAVDMRRTLTPRLLS